MIESKTALITGAASGIGLEAVRRFSEDSKWNPVYAIDTNQAVLRTFPAEVFPSVIPLQLDISPRGALKMVFERIAAESGRLDLVINAAGMMIKGKQSTFWTKDGEPKDEWIEMERVNLLAPIEAMAEAPKIMCLNGGGTIINITSAKHLFPDPHHIEYQIGKMRLSKVTRGIAKHWWQQDRIRLVDLKPGNTKTNIDRAFWTDGNNQAEVAAAQKVTDWWRNKFGNDPKKVADVIYEIAEGRIKNKTVYVGLDAQIGHWLFLLTYPLAGYRLDSLFFAGSTLFYKVAGQIGKMRTRTQKDCIS